MKTSRLLSLTLRIEVEASKYVKVKAYKRIVNGRVVKVRSHYRRIGGC